LAEPPFHVRAVVFDLDGVLVETESINVRSAMLAFSALGHELDPSDAASIVGRHPIDYVPPLADRFGLSAADRDRLKEIQNEAYRQAWDDEARLTEGAVEALGTLQRRGFRLGLGTSAGRAHTERCLRRFRLQGTFEVVLTWDDVARRKPDPEIYLESARRFGLVPREVLVVEDSGYGVQAAIAAGAVCVGVRTPTTPPERIAAAAAVIDSLRGLSALLA
jgi:HAD superfamily hydrolase (TIGR01509 family)